MFRRGNPGDLPSDHLNILGGKTLNFAHHPSGIQSNSLPLQNNYFTNPEEDQHEIPGFYGRVNPTSSTSTIRLAHPSLNHESFANNNFVAWSGQQDQIAKAQTKSVTSGGQNPNSASRSFLSSNAILPPANYIPTNQSLTPIRAEGTYVLSQGQNRTPALGSNFAQNPNSYIRTDQPILRSTNAQNYGTITPVNNSRANPSSGVIVLTSDKKTGHIATQGDVQHIPQQTSYANLPSFTGIKTNNASDQEPKRILANPLSGGMVIRPAAGNNPQTPQDNAAAVPHKGPKPDEKSTRSSLKFEDNKIPTNTETKKNLIPKSAQKVAEGNSQQLSHRSTNSQHHIDLTEKAGARVVKSQAQRQSYGNDLVEISTTVTGTTPISAALRKQSQPTTVNLTFHDQGKNNNQQADFEVNPISDRKKEWRPLIPENDLSNTNVSPMPVVDIAQLNPNYRHVTPPPAQRPVHTRTLNQTENVASRSRLETVYEFEQSEKISQLEKELRRMQLIQSNLQKDKDLALKFNSLLLKKLEGVGATDNILKVY